MPGAAVATMSSAPDDHQPLRDARPSPCSRRYSRRASSGVSVRARIDAGAVGGRGQLDLVVGERLDAEHRRPARTCPRPRRSAPRDPCRAAARASDGGLTVVLPTPPLPATMTRRDAAKNRAGSTSGLPRRRVLGGMPVRRLCGRSRNPGCRPGHGRARPRPGAGRLVRSGRFGCLGRSGAGRRRPTMHPRSRSCKVSGLARSGAGRLHRASRSTRPRTAARSWLVLRLDSPHGRARRARGRAGPAVHDRRRAGRRLGRASPGPGPGAAPAQLAAVADDVEHRAAQPPRRLRRPRRVPGAASRRRTAPPLDRLRTGTVDAEAAVDLDLIDAPAPIIGDFLISLRRASQTSEVDRRTTGPGAQPVTGGRLPLPAPGQPASSTPWPARRSPTCSSSSAWPSSSSSCSPPGSAWPAWSAPGASCSGCYGLAVLPDPTAAAIALLVLAMFGFAVDVQTGVPRVWTGIGVAALITGSLLPLRRAVACRGSRCSWAIGGMLAVHARRHAGDGAHPVLHAHDRAGVDDRRGGRGGHRRRRPTASCRSAARCGGPGPTGPRRSPAGTRCGWSRSTGSLLEVEPLEGAAKDYRALTRKTGADLRLCSR